MESVISFVEDLLAFHACGNTPCQIVGDLVEGDNLRHHSCCVLGGVQHTGY